MVITYLLAKQADVRNNLCGPNRVFQLPGKSVGFTFSHHRSTSKTTYSNQIHPQSIWSSGTLVFFYSSINKLNKGSNPVTYKIKTHGLKLSHQTAQFPPPHTFSQGKHMSNHIQSYGKRVCFYALASIILCLGLYYFLYALACVFLCLCLFGLLWSGKACGLIGCLIV